jgi:hypothetical protein
MDPHLVHAVAQWFDANEEAYRQAGAVAAPRPVDAWRPYLHRGRGRPVGSTVTG